MKWLIKRELHRALVAVKTGPVNQMHGICGNVSQKLHSRRWWREWLAPYGMCMHELRNLAAAWPSRHRTQPLYPVDGLGTYGYELSMATLWDNPRRWQLLDWLIEETKS